MIITTPGYMQTRSLEAGLATLMGVSGLCFLQPGMTTAYPIFADLHHWIRNWITDQQGGTFLIIVCLLRYFALWRNSKLRSSPVLRMTGCGIGAAFWLTCTAAFAKSYHGPIPLLLAMTATVAAKEFYSAFRTGLDADVLDSFRIRQRAFNRREKRRREEASA